ncbi:MAG: oligosaccharide flippase family protein [Chloroflexi bacterium]|nr:oligosaccharide flippase family protein [Chloroflexota bacterium]
MNNLRLKSRLQGNSGDAAGNSRAGSILSGGALLFASMTVVNAGNYLFNLILGRWLGPEAFSDLSLIVTLMLMITFITATFQLTAARFAAIHTADNADAELAGVRRWMGRLAWGLGGLLLVLGVGAPYWQQFFHTASAWPFVILSVGLPLYFVQGVDRGVLQGQTRFGRLALSYQAEMWVRLAAGVAFVALGWAVNGAVGALTLSFVATWLVARAAGNSLPAAPTLSPEARKTVALFAVPVIIAHVSQILINNSDILIVKRFFAAEEAGFYAALALIGRIVFFATWSVVTVLFPIVAQKHKKGEPHRHLLYLSLGLVMAVSGAIFAATLVIPELIVSVLFGQAYMSVAPLLWRYALATAVYALANVVITYRLSIGNGTGSVIAVVGGAAQVLLLWQFHASLIQVVMVQVALMSALLLVLLLWDGLLAWKERRTGRQMPQSLDQEADMLPI